MQTLYDKLWNQHIVPTESTDAGSMSLIYIDRHLVHEVTSPQAFERKGGIAQWLAFLRDDGFIAGFAELFGQVSFAVNSRETALILGFVMRKILHGEELTGELGIVAVPLT